MSGKRAIVLLSGGLDSSVALALAIEQGWEIALTLTYNYYQRANAREQKHAGMISAHFKVPHWELPLPWFKQLTSGGDLLGSGKLPEPKLRELSDRKYTESSAKAVWVPNRNGVFIEIAAGIAEDLGVEGIVVGFNREEAVTFPDNSVAYLEAINRSLSYSTSNHIQVFSPTANMDKSEIVRAGKERDFPFSLLWSCYDSKALMCGRCESCLRLKRGLSQEQVNFDAIFEDTHLS